MARFALLLVVLVGCDADGDGYIAAQYGGSDCNDGNASVHPGGLEIPFDAADSDCDGAPDAADFSFDVYGWTQPRPPRIAINDHGYVVTTATDAFVPFPGTLWDRVGVMVPLGFGQGSAMTPMLSPILWLGAATPLPMGNAVDAAGYVDTVVAATNYEFTGSSGYVTAKVLDYSVAAGSYTATATEWDLIDTDYIASAVDMTVDANGHPWVVSCGANLVQVLRGDLTSSNAAMGSSLGPTPINPLGIDSGVCFWADDPVPLFVAPDWVGTGKVVVCDPGVDCQTYDFDAATELLTPAPSDPWAGRQLRYGQYREGWHILLDEFQTGVELEGPAGAFQVLPTWDVHDVDAHWRPQLAGGWDIVVAAVAEPIPDDGLGPRLVVALGDSSGPFTELELPFQDTSGTDREPSGVGVLLDVDRFVLAATSVDQAGLDDVLGWVAYGW